MTELRCPNCKHLIGLTIMDLNFVYVRGFQYLKEKRRAFHEMWAVPSHELETHIRFLLNSWADEVEVYDQNKKYVEIFKRVVKAQEPKDKDEKCS